MLELCLQQNLISNIFIDDYLRLNAEGDSLFSVKTDNSLKEYQSFTDLQFSKDKTITCLDWHPTVRGLLAVSCAYNLSFDRRIDAMHHITLHPSRVLIWSFVDPIHPMLMLEAPEDVMCFKFNPVNPNIIVGGDNILELIVIVTFVCIIIRLHQRVYRAVGYQPMGR